jgi:hypothetical protein
MAPYTSEPLRERLCIAMFAAWANFRTAANWIPRCVSPLNFCFDRHQRPPIAYFPANDIRLFFVTSSHELRVTPTRRPSGCQCLGCGVRRPLRMSDAYGIETLIVDAISDSVAPFNLGRISFV